MTKEHARSLLRHIWGCPNCLGSGDAKAIERVSQPGETALDTVARIAEVDISGVQPFDHFAIRQRVAEAEAVRAVRARSVAIKDEWGHTRVVGGFGDVGDGGSDDVA